MEKFLVLKSINNGDIILVILIIVIILYLLSKYEETQINKVERMNGKVKSIILEYEENLLTEDNSLNYFILSYEILKMKLSLKKYFVNLIILISSIFLLIGILQTRLIFIYLFVLGIFIALIFEDNMKNNKLYIIALELLIYEKFNISINSKYPL